ncbi:P60-like protein [Dothidotthia symphoricarpi CBS 119687]|uniref:Ribosome biogenesis protein NOP53 n=1 Tax=Dothidotthia symphoricarpi CBS 119687 TaxID=1392245 RepID=A0A6A6AEE2_9PLEO|nr:P60-like protein [Dothidotthia symphoricarpi CBS 119687]KAF2129314.1 P60-like protein [Dothidotthia symphoricarpi CBS 119687]
MADAEAAPAQYKQPSRKGKKAWRKNVDVTQIQSGLKEVREQIIQGGVVAEKPSDQLFAVDTIGSADIQKEVARRHKPLKVDEILAQRSAVPAVDSRKRLADLDSEGKRKKAKVSGKEYDRLRAIAYGGEQVQKDVVQTGSAEYDPWAVQEVKDDPKFSFLEKKKLKVEPSTLKRAPISMARDGKIIPAVRKPAAGKSYNPDFQAWQELLTREADKAVEAEKKRLQEAREEAERMERAAVESESDSGEESVWESEWEGFSDNENSELKKKRPERKTPAQRNKIKRRKDAERLATHEAKVKAKDQQVQKIKELAKSVAEKEKARATAKEILAKMDKANEPLSDDDGEEEELRRRTLGKAPIPDAMLEVVLPDELRDSLRLLKPEGNLLKDRFRSMILRGKVEPRKQIGEGKKRKYTVSEKWSYKDWELNKK